MITSMNEEELRNEYGQVWDTEQLKNDFNVHGFLAPHIACTRKADSLEGSMEFQHMPRFYFKFIDKNGHNEAMRKGIRKAGDGEKLTIGDVIGVGTKDDVKQWTKAFMRRNGFEGL